MRIVGGKYRGKRIDYPKLGTVRPTQDRVKEALFNVIAKEVPGSVVVELFAGSGSLALEAISRGASRAVFVDINPACLKIIRKNIGSIDSQSISEVYKADALKAIERFEKRGVKFNIVFVDPPYHKGLPKKTLIKLARHDILWQNNIIIIEHSKRELIPEVEGINLLMQRQYGDTVLSYCRKAIKSFSIKTEHQDE